MRSIALKLALALVLASVLAWGLAACDPSGGDLGLYRPDMTWGPASNILYVADGAGDWVEQFCDHVHRTCLDAPDYYVSRLGEWRFSQEQCPFEVAELLSCFDALYECGDHGTWQWWEMVSMACAPETYQYEQCMEPYQQWD